MDATDSTVESRAREFASALQTVVREHPDGGEVGELIATIAARLVPYADGSRPWPLFSLDDDVWPERGHVLEGRQAQWMTPATQALAELGLHILDRAGVAEGE